MKDSVIVKRYADAFAGYAAETIGIEKALEDFKNLRSIMRENSGFGEILSTLEITYTEKCHFIDKVLGEGFSEEMRQFLKLLLEKRHIDRLLDIAEYLRITYSQSGKIEALLKTGFPLDTELIKMIKEKLEKKFQKELKFYIELDPTLLGGVQVTIGNMVIDGSVRGRLEELKEKLVAARV